MKQQNTHPQGMFTFEKGPAIYLAFHPKPTSSNLQCARSTDTENFTILPKKITLSTNKHILDTWRKSNHFLISRCEATYYLTYLKNSQFFDPELHLATSTDGLSWEALGKTPMHHPSVLVKASRKKSSPYILYTASGRKYITCSTSLDGHTWEESGVVLGARPRMFDSSFLSPLTARIYKETILLLYTAKNGYGHTTLGASLFHLRYPNILLWRTEVPLWETPSSWKEHSMRIVGGADEQKYFFLYIEKNGNIETLPIVKYWERLYAQINIPKPLQKNCKNITKISPTKEHSPLISIKENPPLTLDRFSGNPILEPNPQNDWEAFAAFNPAAFIEKGTVHLLYRAQGHNGLSVVGYAQSKDGYTIHHRENAPAYIPRETFEGGFGLPNAKDVVQSYMSAGGYGGCEDPKVTLIENRVYLTYVAFNGWEPPRIAISWIPISAFSKQQWQQWSRPILISPPGVVDKSAALFPEKINGKYVIFHRIFPDILIDFVDSLDDFDGKTYLKGQYRISPREGFWDRGKLSVGAPPIRTSEGWLVIYHAVSARIEEGGDLRYKIGAMLLDINDPTKVIVRSREPLLEPETDYENNGHKFGIAYPCGSVIKDNTLFVYYGASDKTVAVATAPIKAFLKALIAQKPFKLKPIKLDTREKKTKQKKNTSVHT